MLIKLKYSQIYDWLRFFIIGQLDYSMVYDWLNVTSDDVILDVGCGTGVALQYLKDFKAYHGFDIDPYSLEIFQSKTSSKLLNLYVKECNADDVEKIRPTKVILWGLLHHIPDNKVNELLESLSSSGSVQRIVTLDTTFIPGCVSNNILARLDRGGYVRNEAGYRILIQESPFDIVCCDYCYSGNKIARYFSTCLKPKAKMNR